MKALRKNKGFAILTVLGIIVLLSIMSVFYVRLAINEMGRVRRLGNDVRAFYVAEAGRSIAERFVMNGEWEDLERRVPKDRPVWIDDAGGEWRAFNLPTPNMGGDIIGRCRYDPIDKTDTYPPAENDFIDIDSEGHVPDIATATATSDLKIRTATTLDTIAAVNLATTGELNPSAIQATNAPAVRIPDENDLTLPFGGGGISGNPDVLVAPFPDFAEVFGMSMDDFKAEALVFDRDVTAVDLDGLTGPIWVEGNCNIEFDNPGNHQGRYNLFSMQGPMVVNGNLRYGCSGGDGTMDPTDTDTAIIREDVYTTGTSETWSVYWEWEGRLFSEGHALLTDGALQYETDLITSGGWHERGEAN